MKKLLRSFVAATALSLSLAITSVSPFTTAVNAKEFQAQELVYDIYLKPGGTYQVSSGIGYQYHVFPSNTKDWSVSSSGLVKASQNPYNIGFVGELFVTDRYGNVIERVTVYINY